MIKTLGESLYDETPVFLQTPMDSLQQRFLYRVTLVEIGDSCRCFQTYSLGIYKHLFFSMSCRWDGGEKHTLDAIRV